MERARGFRFWTPRVLAILYAAFISLFALDVFSETHGFLQTAAALAIHLIPAFVVLALLALAWRRELVGAIGFAALAAAYVLGAWGRFHWTAYAVISGPLLLLSVLFLWSRGRGRRGLQRHRRGG